jgi:hypothetical protein
MPEIYRRPRRRTGGSSISLDFSSESEVREAVAAVRSAFPTIDAAEQSLEWRELRPRVARWVLSHAKQRPITVRDAWATRIATIYLRKPQLLPQLRSEAEQ